MPKKPKPVHTKRISIDTDRGEYNIWLLLSFWRDGTVTWKQVTP